MYLIVKHHSLTHCCCIPTFYTTHHTAAWCGSYSLAHISDQYYNLQRRSWQQCWSQIGDWVQLGFSVGCSMLHWPLSEDHCTSLYRITLLKLESNTLIDRFSFAFDFAIAHHCIFLWLWHFVNWSYVHWGWCSKFIWKMRKLTKKRKGRHVREYFYL